MSKLPNLPKFPRLLLALLFIAASPLAAQPAAPVSEPPLSSSSAPAQAHAVDSAPESAIPSAPEVASNVASEASSSPAAPLPDSTLEQELPPTSETPAFPVPDTAPFQAPAPSSDATPPASVPEKISPQAALVGVYVGDLPCADCSGQRWRLALEADHHYRLRLTYLDRGVVELFGRWRLEADGKLHLEDDTENILLQVGENRLRLLDQEGQPIVSSFNYDLERQPDDMPLRGTEWQLRHLKGQALAPDSILLRLEAEDRFSGFGGCNRIVGAYRLADNRLEFSRIVGTKMICLGDNSMALESALLNALMQVRRWEIQGRRLHLRDAAEAVLLELEAVEPSVEADETLEAPQENPQAAPQKAPDAKVAQ
jgi:heat shock protein HslJ